MQEKNHMQRLKQAWDEGVERAQQESLRTPDLGDLLDQSAGLHVKAGVRAGGWLGDVTGDKYSCVCNPH
jgi:hypothetical protein